MSRWTLTFRAEGDGPPVECRVRRLLKAALRCYGLRCVGYGDGETPRHAAQDARSEGRMTRKPSEVSKRASDDGTGPAEETRKNDD